MRIFAIFLIGFILCSCNRGNDEIERAQLQTSVKNPFETVLQSFSNVAN